MLEQIKQIVDYVQLRVNYSVKETEETESIYLHVLRNKVRISTHNGIKYDCADVQVLIDTFNSRYCILVWGEVMIFNSYRKVGDFLINYYFLSTYETKLKNDISELKNINSNIIGENQRLNSKLEKQIAPTEELEEKVKTQIELNDKYKAIMRSNEKKQSEYKAEIAGLRSTIKELQADCNEAADLLKILSTDPNAREMITNKEGKKYFIDNFPTDVQDVLMDIIKEYYDR